MFTFLKNADSIHFDVYQEFEHPLYTLHRIRIEDDSRDKKDVNSVQSSANREVFKIELFEKEALCKKQLLCVLD